MVDMTRQTEEMKKILEKLYKIESRHALFEFHEQFPEKRRRGLRKTFDLIYKEADNIATYLSERIKHDKDELKLLIREMVITYEKVLENIIFTDEQNGKNSEVQKE